MQRDYVTVNILVSWMMSMMITVIIFTPNQFFSVAMPPLPSSDRISYRPSVVPINGLPQGFKGSSPEV